MKKILTLLIAAGAFVTLHAQSNGEARREVLGYPNGSYDRQYPVHPDGGYGNHRQFEVDRINRDYDMRIQSVLNDPYMHHRDKKREVKALENERRFRIDEINRGYANYDPRYNRHDDDRYERDHRDNDRRW